MYSDKAVSVNFCPITSHIQSTTVKHFHSSSDVGGVKKVFQYGKKFTGSNPQMNFLLVKKT